MSELASELFSQCELASELFSQCELASELLTRRAARATQSGPEV